ncbi:MAG: TldD/PmbA family protein [Polyangiaceae bacterium]|nr:TldD/PmbA family protein [Polyangiaceae bacterium]
MTEPKDLEAIATQVMQAARAKGADVAEVSLGQSWDLSVKVRLGNVELLEEAGSSGLALRVIRGDRVSTTSTTDFSEAGLLRCVEDALMLVELSEADPFAAPADPSQLAKGPFQDLELFDPQISSISATEAISRARDAEEVALSADPRLTLSEGATFGRTSSESVLVLSGGFVGRTRGSYASLVVTPVAEDEDGKRRRGHYWSAARHLLDLESPEQVGREAARRTLAKLGAKKVKTCTAPVIFDPDVSRSIIGAFAGCIMGGGIWRRSSYLLEREGTEVASPLVTMVDDPFIKRGPGSKVFDGEGLPTRRNVVVENGILRTYLCDCYSARKLGRASTGNAGRGGGSIGASTTNFILQPGSMSAAELLAATPTGLYVTEMMGMGFNPVTGDFSRGAAGFWIENGKLAFPVSEVTISSNLDTMLKSMDAIANDLTFKTSTAAPTFRVAAMTIAGT